MHGLMMDYELTLLPISERVGKYFPNVEIVSRWPDKSIHRSTYGEFHKRVQQMANALEEREQGQLVVHHQALHEASGAVGGSIRKVIGFR